MGLVFQMESWQPPALQTNGCYTLAIMAIPQLHHSAFLPDSIFPKVLAELVNGGAVEPDFSIRSETAPWDIMRAVSIVIGHTNYRGAEVGETNRMGTYYYSAVKRPGYNYAILWGRLANGTEHKVLCDWSLREIYNPKPGAEIVTKERYILYFYGLTADVDAIFNG